MGRSGHDLADLLDLEKMDLLDSVQQLGRERVRVQKVVVDMPEALVIASLMMNSTMQLVMVRAVVEWSEVEEQVKDFEPP